MDETERYRILIVDDMPERLKSMELFLSGMNADLVLTLSGEEALEAAGENDFALILLDVKMPGMDGFETAAGLRKCQRSENTPIIFITSATSNDLTLVKGYSQGAIDFIFLPINPAILVSKVNAFLEMHHSKQRLITELEEKRVVEAKLQESNAALSEKTSELKEFVRIAGHDLKEPLRTLLSYCQLLHQDLGEDISDVVARDINFIASAAARLNALVDSLLSFTKAGESALKASHHPLQDCVDRAIESLAKQIENTGAKIRCNDLPEMFMDVNLMTVLMQNLISNAIKFIPPEKKPDIDISAKHIDGQWVVAVRDNGIGMAAEQASQVFVPFRRAHNHSQYEGTGIGLAICHKIIERHRGQLWLTSEPDHGSTFYFTVGLSNKSS